MVMLEGLHVQKQRLEEATDGTREAWVDKPPCDRELFQFSPDTAIKELHDDSLDVATWASHEEPEAEPEAKPVDKRPVKVIFVDVDGPLAPYSGRAKHFFSPKETFADKPYDVHFRALRRIVEECGGPDVVKIVLSSNWRTMPDRVAWLEVQFRQLGLDCVGHTDVMHLHPARFDQEATRRTLELQRVLSANVVGCGGPYSESGKPNEDLRFSKRELPRDWNIVSWIAIDDLCFDAVSEDVWDCVKLYSAFVTLPSDNLSKRSWIRPPEDFGKAMRSWCAEFHSNHLVEVSPYSGLANTPDAVQRAIKLLNVQ